MHKFVLNFLSEWRKLSLPFADKTFVVAISGGADSVSLALAANELKNQKKLNLRFVLAHFNHALRGQESVEDAEFVKNLAENLEFELAYAAQNQESRIENQKGNLEQNARLARYKFLTETAKNINADGILTAHTLNDQAETFLLNLIRGSGLEGLGGMKTVRNLNTENQNSKVQLIRPLLRWAKREDTENFCLMNKIEFRNDSMNEDLAYRRVRIRKILLPLLIDFNPKIIETLGKTAELLKEDAELLAQKISSNSLRTGLETESETFLKNGENETGDFLVLSELIDVFPSMRRLILRDWLKKQRGDLRRLSSKHFEAIENLILSHKSGKTVELPANEIVLKKSGKIFYKKTGVDKSQTANYN